MFTLKQTRFPDINDTINVWFNFYTNIFCKLVKISHITDHLFYNLITIMLSYCLMS